MEKSWEITQQPKERNKGSYSQQTILNAHLLIATFSYLYHNTALSVFSPVYSDQAQKTPQQSEIYQSSSTFLHLSEWKGRQENLGL